MRTSALIRRFVSCNSACFAMATFSVSKPKPKVYPPDPSGVCIYCGQHEANGLRREHIIPIGLGSGLILRKASCLKCQKITGDFEATCMKKSFFSFRYHFDLIRHTDEIPEKVPFHLLSLNDDATIPYLTPDKLPNFLPLPLVHMPPGMISGRPPGFPSPFTLQIFGKDLSLKESLEKQGQFKSIEKLFDVISFMRMLAKIAHSFAVAELGLNGFGPELTEFIRTGWPPLAGFYIGNGSAIHVPITNDHTLHQVAWAPVQWGHQWLVAVRIRLFAGFGPTPIYMAIAGPLTRELQARHGLPALGPSPE